MNTVLKLETKRLRIEPFNIDDAITIQQLANDKIIANIIGLPHPYEIRIAQEWIEIQPELIRQRKEYPLKIVVKELNTMIGTITLRIDHPNNRGELGYWIGQKYWGNGYGTEAVTRMIDFGFVDLGLNRIWAFVISRNIASIKVLEKTGLQKEGTLRKNRLLNDTYEDVNVYGILRTEFRQ